MTYLLDTDVFSLAYYRKHGLRERIAVERATTTVAIPVVTRMEVLRGRFDAVLKAVDGAALTRAVEGLITSEAYLVEFAVLAFDAAVATFDRFRQDGGVRKMGRNDLLTACITLAHDATLVTRNIKDFALVPGLRLVNWAD